MLIRDNHIYVLALMLTVCFGVTVFWYQTEQYLGAIISAIPIGTTITSIMQRYFFLKLRRETRQLEAEFRKRHGDTED